MISLFVVMSLILHRKELNDDLDPGAMLAVSIVDIYILYGIQYLIGG